MNRRMCGRMVGLSTAAACLLLTSVQPAAQARDAMVAAVSGGRIPTAAVGVAVLSGGIGETDKERMRQAADDYNVHLVFSNPRGEYLADVPFSVIDPKGQTVVSGTSEGPLLYLRLPPGNYRVAAALGGSPVGKRIKVPPAGNGVKDINIVINEQ